MPTLVASKQVRQGRGGKAHMIADFQPGNGDWVVPADPEGHLLCVATDE